MTQFRDTDAAQKFIASGASRETSREVMTAIAFFARSIEEAEDFWNGDFDANINRLCIWEHATGNGGRDADLSWGAADDAWAQEFASGEQ